MGGWRVRRVSLHPLPVHPALSSSAISAFCANESPARNESSSANVLSSGYADFSFSRVFSFLFQRSIVPCLTRQRPRLLFLSILFAWRMYPIIYKSTVDVFLSVKIKKCVLIIYKSSADVLFFFGENKKVCVEEWEKKISIVFELLCIIDYIRYLIIIAFIRIRIFYIFEFGFTERDRVSVLFWFPPLFVRAARRDIASSA